MANAAAEARSGSYYRLLTPRAKIKYFSAIFFIFAPASILLLSPFDPKRSFACLITWAAMGGLTAAGWAYFGTCSRRIIWVLLPAQALWFLVPGFLFADDFRSGFTFSVEGAFCIALIVTGYILFIYFIGAEGAKNIRMQAELTLAHKIHASLIPPVALTTERLELYGKSNAGAEMGGDLLDVVCDDCRTDVFIADVSGHGVRAGVVMGMVKSALRTRLRSGTGLGELLTDVNQVIEELTSPELFVTAACLRFDTSGPVEFAGAGHGPVLHFRHASRRLAYLDSEHLPLGVVRNEDYAASVHIVEPGDVLLLMTDGLTETFDEADELFGQHRVEAILTEHSDVPLPAVYDAIMSAVAQHGPQSDDRTLLLVRVRS